jgi:hypothetical protein
VKRKIILSVLLVIVLAAGLSVSLATRNHSVAQAQTTLNRLVGVAQDGMIYEQNAAGRFSFFRIVLNNPGRTTKYIDKIDILDATALDPDGKPKLVMTLSHTQNPDIIPESIGPHQVFVKDSDELGLPHDMNHWKWYSVVVIWSGGGETLEGELQEFWIKFTKDRKTGQMIQSMDDMTLFQRQMTYSQITIPTP